MDDAPLWPGMPRGEAPASTPTAITPTVIAPTETIRLADLRGEDRVPEPTHAVAA